MNAYRAARATVYTSAALWLYAMIHELVHKPV